MELFKLVGKIVIDASSATQTIDATITASEDLAEMLGTVSQKADDAGEKMSSRGRIGTAAVWLGNTLHTLTNKLGSFAVSAIKSGLDFNANIESYQAQFAALLQNEEKAQDLVAKIQELAKVSPLGMEGLAKNAVQLLSAGTELTEIMPTLEMLGNLSLGDSTKMDYIVTAYTQIMNTGKLKAQEINQLINAGVPIIRLLTEYGGEKFADGTWYQEFLNNPKEFYVTAEEVNQAMKAATEEGGDYYEYMFNMMDTYSGQLDRLGEEGKEAMGQFMEPFNEVLSSKVFPKISELFSSFGTWASENAEGITTFAEALGDFAVWGLQGLIDGFKYLVEHGPELMETIKGIAKAAGSFFQNVASFFGFGADEEPVGNPDQYSKYAGWTAEQKKLGKEYIELSLEGLPTNDFTDKLLGAGLDISVVDSFYDEVSDAIDANQLSVEIADAWFNEGTESGLQSELDGFNLTATVNVEPVLSGFSKVVSTVGSWFNSGGSTDQPESNNASGLRYVPHDNYLANLHIGETVLPRNEADEYRSGSNGTDTSSLISAINSLSDRVSSIMQQVATNTATGTSVYLDSGVLVGQLTPSIDTQLGTITTRKGRRN